MSWNRQDHWNATYARQAPDELSWYQPQPGLSLDLLLASGVQPGEPIIDVGGGASSLVDALLDRSLGPVTVLDLAGEALARARARLGPRAGQVTWLEADVTRADLPHSAFRVWHDRAVFHFLTDEMDRARYLQRAAQSVVLGGSLVLGTFAPDGPAQCSGLSVVRYGADGLAEVMAPYFLLVEAHREQHVTPSGAEQPFTTARFVRQG